MPKRKRTIKPIPEFGSEAEEQDFWATHDTSEYFDWSKARRVAFPALKPSTTPISLRLPETLLGELKRLAHEQDVPYQSLMKVYLAERVAIERRRRGKKAGV
ncbi:MAG: BrnA antitoxin family protein [Longimicrobiales bacterium]|nr:BrnA antitoxin family protein [Longimicrobiales bacterium]